MVRAPGRGNLIGEHTDYNEGFVLPVALELATYVAGRRIQDRIRLRSMQEPGEATVELARNQESVAGWGRYAAAVVRALRDEGVELQGLTGWVTSEIPIGAGLGSSAALEVAIAMSLMTQQLDRLELAEACRRAENQYVGTRCGIMDQLACTAARAGHALLIDCRSNEIEHIPLPASARLVVVDSGVRRRLSEGTYNRRRSECEQAARALGKPLRDVSSDDLARHRERIPEEVFRRARHVVSENDRVLQAAEALALGRLGRVGELFYDSHASLASDFEVSAPELDCLVDVASKLPGVHGARLTGAGFGGCTVNLVEADAAQDVAAALVAGYRARTGRHATAWVSRAAEGASFLVG